MSCTEYVAGFMFSESEKYVALIKKTRPPRQAGKMNGIGGHIEPGEAPLDAMVREFFEETGVQTEASDWKMFCTIGDNAHFKVYFYSTRSNKIANVQTTTDESVHVVAVADLATLTVLSNVRWLVSMALSLTNGENARSFEIIEH